jgi:uncharacterized protein
MKRIAQVTIAVLSLLLATSAVPNVTMAQESKMETKIARTISVSGHGETRAKPDLAVVQLGVFANAKTAREALATNTKSMSGLIAKLKTSGVSDRDMQTSNFSVNPRLIYAQDGSNTQPKMDGYDVTNSLTVTVRDLNNLGGLLDDAVSNGANQINGITFGIEDDTAAVDEARKRAVADARRKAELYATAAGVKLGQVISISEGGGYVQPTPVMYSRAKADMASADVPIAQGEQVLGADVNVVWGLE